MGPICGYSGGKPKEKVEKMLSASRFCGTGKLWHAGKDAIGQISPENELNGYAFDGIFYDFDLAAIQKVHTQGDLRKILLKSNGDYSLAIAVDEKIFLARDPIGARSMHYGFDSEGFAFSSEKAMLHAIGMKDTKSLSPGCTLADGKKQEDFRENIFRREEKLIESEAQALNLLRSTLDRAIEIRVRAIGSKKAGILFSGGVDSSTLASKIPEAMLYVAGIRGSHDLEQAKKSSIALGAESKLRVIETDLMEVEEQIPEIMRIIKTANPMDVELALTLFFATRAMRYDRIEVAISGQGSDELFGGYSKHATALIEGGEAVLHQMLIDNVMNIASENLERDVAIVTASSLELIVPYLDMNLVRLVLGFDPKLKISARENAKGYSGKYILRKLVGEFIPQEIAWKDKKAMQYGSGMHAALKIIAGKNGFTGARRAGRYLASMADKDKRC